MHMEPEVRQGLFFAVETAWGLEYVPEEDVGYVGVELGEEIDPDFPGFKRAARALRPYLLGRPVEISLVKGWGARLSAAGYLDASDWVVFESEAEALAYLQEEMGVGNE